MSRKTKPAASHSRKRRTAHVARDPRPLDFTRSDIIALLAPQEADERRRAKTLRGAILSGLDLSGIDFSNVDVSNASFIECDLTNAVFRQALCAEADFTAAVLKDTEFNSANLIRAKFVQATVTGADFSFADASETDWREAIVESPYFTKADLAHASFEEADLRRVEFRSAKLGHNNWTGVKLSGCSFHGATAAGFDRLTRPADLPVSVEWTPDDRDADGAPALPAGPSNPSGAIGEVWDAWSQHFDTDEQELAGFLVTEKGDPGRLIAFVRRCRQEKCRDQQLLAWKIALHREELDGGDSGAWDLREYCCLDSPRPTPMEFYAYKIARPGTGGDGSVPLFPFCKFRLAKMIATHNRLWLTPQERKVKPFDQIGAGDAPAEGECQALVRSIAITSEQMPL
jgi:uncharacterized protein YjbI with pentapeptide repeats